MTQRLKSARRATCASQLRQCGLAAVRAGGSAGWRQCGLAALAHVESHGGFPHSGGAPRTGRNAWGWAWQVLPFLEQLPLFNNPNDQFCQAQAVPTYFCPTRRPPVSIAGGYWAATSLPRGMLDYAGNGGSDMHWTWSAPAVSPGNGLFVQHSVAYPLTPAHVRDGLSSTLLFGEKCMNRSFCTTDQQPDDNEGYTVPWEDDNTRWATSNAFTGLRADITGPKYTFSTILPHNRAFGSSHAGVVQFVFCDGSVQSLSLDVSDETLRPALQPEGWRGGVAMRALFRA